MRKSLNSKYIFFYKDPWKKEIFKKFSCVFAQKKILFQGLEHLQPIKKNFTKCLWGIQDYIDLKLSDEEVIIIEDGFLRSAGLGADLIMPKSLCFDSGSSHFDWKRPTDLERLLRNYRLNKNELILSAQLLKIITANNLTKYGCVVPLKKISLEIDILIVGQNQTDAALKFGSDEINSNFMLCKKVRQLNPNRKISFLDHPDNYLMKKLSGQECSSYVDEILSEDVDCISAINASNEVHVITSLLGFEAILRQKEVHVYGFPFYWGWGLTNDFFKNRELSKRRNKTLKLKEMLWIAYGIYPKYVNNSGMQTDVFEIANEIILESKNTSLIKIKFFKLFRYSKILISNFIKKLKKYISYK